MPPCYGSRVTVVRRGSLDVPAVALTFDDCDDADAWDAILDILEQSGSRASFFPLGFRVAEFPTQARRTARSGHTCGSHSWDHVDLRGQAFDEIRRGFLRHTSVWRAVTGCAPLPWLRPPYGCWNRTTARAAFAAGFDHILLWDVDPEDWRLPGVRAISERVLASGRRGSIVDLHVTAQTAQALPDIITGLRARGLEPTSLEHVSSAVRRARRP